MARPPNREYPQLGIYCILLIFSLYCQSIFKTLHVMKRLSTMFLVLSAVMLISAGLPKKKKVIFFGDSITQAGVSPEGYITQLGKLLQESHADQYELIGAGIGGNKVYDLYLRMEDDVLKKKPDVVVIYIGVNDVWHKATSHTGTDLDKFGGFYRALIKKIQANGAKVILCTPAVIGEKKDGDNEQDAELNRFSNSIRTIARETNLPLCDLRQLFTDFDKANNPQNADKGILTTDGVHLNKEGNALVAKSIGEILVKL
jgi:lysophospholipase L1-like esterase